MSLRTSSLFLLAFALSACGGEVSPEPDGSKIDCAIGPGAQFERACTLETISDLEFVIHHPGGGFRRFGREAPGDGGKITSFDGADLLEVDVSDESSGAFEIKIGQDRYRFDASADDE